MFLLECGTDWESALDLFSIHHRRQSAVAVCFSAVQSLYCMQGTKNGLYQHKRDRLGQKWGHKSKIPKYPFNQLLFGSLPTFPLNFVQVCESICKLVAANKRKQYLMIICCSFVSCFLSQLPVNSRWTQTQQIDSSDYLKTSRKSNLSGKISHILIIQRDLTAGSCCVKMVWRVAVTGRSTGKDWLK